MPRLTVAHLSVTVAVLRAQVEQLTGLTEELQAQIAAQAIKDQTATDPCVEHFKAIEAAKEATRQADRPQRSFIDIVGRKDRYLVLAKKHGFALTMRGDGYYLHKQLVEAYQ